MRRTPAIMARKEEMESLARREGQEGEGMRGSHGRRELSQGGAEDNLVYVRITLSILFNLLEGKDKGNWVTSLCP